MKKNSYPQRVVRPFVGKSRILYYFAKDGRVHKIEKNVEELIKILNLCNGHKTVKSIAEKVHRLNQIEEDLTYQLISKLKRRGIIEAAPPPKRKRWGFGSLSS